MNESDVLALLLGPVGLLVGSLLLNYLQMRGIVLSRRVVAKEEYERVLALNGTYADIVDEQTKAIAGLTRAVDRLRRAKTAV